MPFIIPNVPLEAVALNGEPLMPDVTSNAARLRAYHQKMRVWSQEHPDEYHERTRKGIRVRDAWHTMWNGKVWAARQGAAPVLRLVSVHPSFGAGA